MIFITGAHATGKTHLADIICQNNFTKIDLGPVIRAAHRASGSEKKFSEWIQEKESQFGEIFTDNLIVDEIKRIIEASALNDVPPIDFLIIGSRSLRGVKYIMEHVEKYNNKENKIIYLEAPFLIMYERYKKRENVNITEDEFQKVLDRDREMGIEELRPVAHFIIVNDSTNEQLEEKINGLLRHELEYKELEKTWENQTKKS